ncbi:uncharacterized protein TRUGW13939_10344 [Talaromyces rugulosus]|uniref:Protein kinase domain-containing protein n=1 Tax=Talaromyces rugulosus TaxID=121627 RepID=A0A7H8RCF0_TALRU|nr:uncharacterized protein TRUGW13939_10344 [Talaromyces rugulosus]QKX63175.1 hypothetical protein TRUGW13939_10344 [Talaromyces rugulosus]
MADDSSPDYKALFQKAEEERRHEAKLRRQEAELRRQAEEREKQAEEREKQAEEREKREAELRRRAEARTQPTTFRELIQTCHVLFSESLKAGTPTKSTKGQIPTPTGKYYPKRLCLWSDCPVQQQKIYTDVCNYLEPLENEPSRRFASLAELHGLSRRFDRRLLRSEKDLESYERFAVEDYVHDIITELCNIPDAKQRFRLGNGVAFDNHANTLDETEDDDANVLDTSSSQHPRPDQFCIHRVDGTTNTLLTTVEYKPPHKLSVENLRVGLRPMDFGKEVVNKDKIPIDKNDKLKYNAEQLVGSVLVQEYHVMIQEGLEYSYITNGLALVLLYVPYHDYSTLYYYHCEPKKDANLEDPDVFQQPVTAIARVLCLCLMSFHSQIRDQAWRNAARSQLDTWKTSFDHTRSQIPEKELKVVPPDSDYTSSEYTSSEYLPSSPLPPTSGPTRPVPTRSRSNCAPMETTSRGEQTESSDSEAGPAPSRKRGFSQILSSPPNQRSSTRPVNSTPPSGNQHQHAARFCTQRCLLGLQQRDALDNLCPNVHLHRQDQEDNRHCIDTKRLVKLLKVQLDQDLDHNCTPFGACGSYGAPFKITCATYGYTVVGKGTTSKLWKEVSSESEIYQVLQKVQGSAVPVFLGTIDLRMTFFLHGAGEIRHMLLMGWGGESIGAEQRVTLRHEISRSRRQIRKLGVIHQDLRLDNMLWNDELKRVLIIDFHRSEIDRRSTRDRVGSLKRPMHFLSSQSKRPRLLYT